MTAWTDARNVLCVRLDNMGDVLMTTPAMQALADAAPGRKLTLLTSRPAAALAPHLPMIDDLLAWDAPWVRHPSSPGVQEVATDVARFARLLAGRGFDAAVVFTVYSQSALPAAMLCSMAGIPLRLAYCRENPYALLSDWVIDKEPATVLRHEVQRQLDLVAHIGASTDDMRLRFAVLDADRERVLSLLGEHTARHAADRHIVVHPGATAASRRWPPERFAEVARALARETGALVLVTGSAGERAIVDAVKTLAAHDRVVPLAGVLSLGEMGALIEAADLLVSNNSGPVHMAAAAGTPVADLYALTNPQHTPWMVPHRVLFQDVPCRYCYKSQCPQGHHRCLLDVTVSDVVNASLELLHGVRQSARIVPQPMATDGHAATGKTFVEEPVHVHAWH